MADAAERFHFIADRGDARLRLDQVLVRRAQDVVRLSRHVAQRWIEAGAVTVAGRPVLRCSAGVAEGAHIEVVLPDTARVRTRPEAEHGHLDILYEDHVLMAVNKPPGLVVHPTYKTTTGTLLNALLWHVRDRPLARPSILTRLDKGTSGLVLVALQPEVHATVQRAAAAGRVAKEYLALVAGSPQPASGRITLALARDPKDRRRVVVAPNGAASETRYQVVSSNDVAPFIAEATWSATAQATAPAGAPATAPTTTPATVPEAPSIAASITTHAGPSVVRCELITGRTHQIRVHLAAMGWPILGDAVYGVPHPELTRQALHACRIALPHPITGSQLDITAPMAADIARIIS